MNSTHLSVIRDFLETHYAWAASHLPIILIALAIWSLAWKGVALWFAARNYEKKWFIVLLILNTVGILDIIYLLWFRRDKQKGETQSLFNNPLPGPGEETQTVAGNASA